MYYLFREELANIKKHISGLLPFFKKIPLTAVREKGSKGKSRALGDGFMVLSFPLTCQERHRWLLLQTVLSRVIIIVNSLRRWR